MHLGYRYSSLNRIALQNIRENKKIFAHNFSHFGMHFERFSVFLRHSRETFCAKQLLVTKSSSLRKRASVLAFGNFSISKTNKGKESYDTYL